MIFNIQLKLVNEAMAGKHFFVSFKMRARSFDNALEKGRLSSDSAIFYGYKLLSVHVSQGGDFFAPLASYGKKRGFVGSFKFSPNQVTI